MVSDQVKGHKKGLAFDSRPAALETNEVISLDTKPRTLASRPEDAIVVWVKGA